MALFAHSFQGGPSFEVFTAHGSNPASRCKIYGGKAVQKVYDKSVRGFVYACSGGASSKIQFPKDEKKAGLLLLQPYLVLQIFVPANQHFSIELSVTESTGSKQKMYLSTSFSEIKTTPLHCQVPLTMVKRNTWLNLALDVPDLLAGCCRGATFRCVDLIVLGSVFKLRKIFTLRSRPLDLMGLARYEPCTNTRAIGTGAEPIPQEHSFATGVESFVQILDMARVQEALNIKAGVASAVDSTQLNKNKVAGSATEGNSGSRLLTSTKADFDGPMHVAFGTRAPVPLVAVNANIKDPPLSGSDRNEKMLPDAAAYDYQDGVDDEQREVSDGESAKSYEIRFPVVEGSSERLVPADSVMGSDVKVLTKVADKVSVRNSVDVKGLGRKGGSDWKAKQSRGGIVGSPPSPGKGFTVDSSKRVLEKRPVVAQGSKRVSAVGSRRHVTPVGKQVQEGDENVIQEKAVSGGPLVNKSQSKRVYCRSRYTDSPPASPVQEGWEMSPNCDSSDDRFLEEHRKRLMQGTTPSNGKSSRVEMAGSWDSGWNVRKAKAKPSLVSDSFESKPVASVCQSREGPEAGKMASLGYQGEGGERKSQQSLGRTQGSISRLFAGVETGEKQQKNDREDGRGDDGRQSLPSSPLPPKLARQQVAKTRTSSRSSGASSLSDDSSGSGGCRRCSLYEASSQDGARKRGISAEAASANSVGKICQGSISKLVAKATKAHDESKLQSPWRAPGKYGAKSMSNAVRASTSVDSGSSRSDQSSGVEEGEAVTLCTTNGGKDECMKRRACSLGRSGSLLISSSSASDQSLGSPDVKKTSRRALPMPIPSKSPRDCKSKVHCNADTRETPHMSRSLQGLGKGSIDGDENAIKNGIQRNEFGRYSGRPTASTRMQRSCEFGSLDGTARGVKSDQSRPATRKSAPQPLMEKREVGVYEKTAISERLTAPRKCLGSDGRHMGRNSVSKQTNSSNDCAASIRSGNAKTHLLPSSGKGIGNMQSSRSSPRSLNGIASRKKMSKADDEAGVGQQTIPISIGTRGGKKNWGHEESPNLEMQDKHSSTDGVCNGDGIENDDGEVRLALSPIRCDQDLFSGDGSESPPKTPPDLLRRVSQSFSSRAILEGDVRRNVSGDYLQSQLQISIRDTAMQILDRGKASFSNRNDFHVGGGGYATKTIRHWDGRQSLDSDSELDDQGSPLFGQIRPSERDATGDGLFTSVGMDCGKVSALRSWKSAPEEELKCENEHGGHKSHPIRTSSLGSGAKGGSGRDLLRKHSMKDMIPKWGSPEAAHDDDDDDDQHAVGAGADSFQKDESPQVIKFINQPVNGGMHDSLKNDDPFSSYNDMGFGSLSSILRDSSRLQDKMGDSSGDVEDDDHLDLLYDPILDCYYDPKTNRYYELKGN